MSEAPTLSPSPHAPLASASESPLGAAAASVEGLAAGLRADPGRLALWQVLNGAVEAAQVMRVHARVCASPAGTLADITAADPSQVSAVRAAWAEHDGITRLANTLVGAAHALGEPDGDDVTAISERAKELARRLRCHDQRVTTLVYEAALRETGGEA
jgi:hypothetical protein